MADVTALWDFDDPAGTLARFRLAADAASGDERSVLLTQVARGLGLLERYDEGHAVLDGLPAGSEEVAVRAALERGRLLNSAGEPTRAMAHFERAAQQAEEAGLEALRVDALHMVAIAAPVSDRRRLNEEALGIARSSADPDARDWDAALLNNLGMCLVDEGDLAAALTTFTEARAACERIGDEGRTRVARWMVAWVLRLTGRPEDARLIQLALKAELHAIGATDPYVDEELALLDGPPPTNRDAGPS